MRRIRVVGPLLTCLAVPLTAVLILIANPPARAADPLVAVSASPGSLTLTPGASGSGVLVITSGATSGAPIRVALKAVISEVGYAVALGARVVDVPPGGAEAVAFTVSRSATRSTSDAAVTFVAAVLGGSPTVVTSALPISAADASPALSAEIKTSITDLDENHSGDASLIVTNLSNSFLTVSGIVVRSPADVQATVDCGDRERQVKASKAKLLLRCVKPLPPRGQAVVALHLTSATTLAPGPRTLIVQVRATPSHAQPTSVVVAQDFTVEVYGQSDLLKALDLPTFLLLPGVVILLTSSFLISKATWWRRVTLPAPSSLVMSVSLVTIGGLTISLLFAAAYPYLTRWIPGGPHRDYRIAQAYDDFYWVLLWSFVVSMVAWAVGAVLYLARPRIRSQVVYEPQDSPADVLRKAALRSRFGGPSRFHLMGVSPPASDHGSTSKTPSTKGLRVPSLAPGDDVTICPRVCVPSRPGSLLDQAMSDYEMRPDRQRLRRLWYFVQWAGVQDELTFAAGDLPAVARVAAATSSQVGPTVRAIAIREPT